MGAVISPVTPQILAREVRYLIANSGARVVVTKPVLAERLRDATEGLEGFEHLLVIGETSVPGAENIEPDILSADPICGVEDRAAGDLAMLLYTSGTTGKPKGVMLTHANLLTNARACVEANPIPPLCSTLHVLPLSHSFGVLCMNLGALLDCRSVILPKFETQKVFESVERHRVERFSVVPTMLSYMLNFADRAKYDTSSLRVVSTGGGPLHEELRVEFERSFNVRVKDGYGLSESAPAATAYRDTEPHRKGSVGRAIPGVSIRIADSEGQTLAPRAEGEICIQGANIMRGYWGDEAATRAAIVDGWLRTGDVGYMDEEGYIYITDRKKDLIIKGGENISPREIEEVIYEHPAVAEVAVIGMPDESFSETVCAVIALRPGQSASEAEMQEHVGRYLTRFKVPSRVFFKSELPKSSVGKLLKRELRRELTGG